ncbi:hypothetical protein HEP89_16170 [Labrenzia sp. 5N]|uniref:hypothetical protein n=1 Tax=Labrenzia sp. 5N TaxID=2723402 RepID=UPI0014462511|nr:hypothetical protein [Labrenzia sp. 5N]NKX65656.1 hypothetical protein [Labrenzia sp. 5N]
MFAYLKRLGVFKVVRQNIRMFFKRMRRYPPPRLCGKVVTTGRYPIAKGGELFFCKRHIRMGTQPSQSRACAQTVEFQLVQRVVFTKIIVQQAYVSADHFKIVCVPVPPHEFADRHIGHFAAALVPLSFGIEQFFLWLACFLVNSLHRIDFHDAVSILVQPSLKDLSPRAFPLFGFYQLGLKIPAEEKLVTPVRDRIQTLNRVLSRSHSSDKCQNFGGIKESNLLFHFAPLSEKAISVECSLSA